MAQHKSTRASTNAGVSVARDAALNRVAAEPGTIEDRLLGKAELADAIDVSRQRSLGQMTRAAQCRVLFGE
jgi:hypothetical protein